MAYMYDLALLVTMSCFIGVIKVFINEYILIPLLWFVKSHLQCVSRPFITVWVIIVMHDKNNNLISDRNYAMISN